MDRTDSATNRRRSRPAHDQAQARNTSARNALTTGLAAAVATVSTAVSTIHRRWAATRAPRATASPSANGSRPTATFVTVPTANHIDASRHRRPVAWRRSRSARNAAAADAEHGDGPDAEHRAEQREQDPVAQRVVPAVPEVVPDLEPVPLDDGDPEEVGRQVRAPPTEARASRASAAATAAGRSDGASAMEPERWPCARR